MERVYSLNVENSRIVTVPFFACMSNPAPLKIAFSSRHRTKGRVKNMSNLNRNTKAKEYVVQREFLGHSSLPD